THIYTLSLHDALPISRRFASFFPARNPAIPEPACLLMPGIHAGTADDGVQKNRAAQLPDQCGDRKSVEPCDQATRCGDVPEMLRSEEHTSELQSLAYL